MIMQTKDEMKINKIVLCAVLEQTGFSSFIGYEDSEWWCSYDNNIQRTILEQIISEYIIRMQPVCATNAPTEKIDSSKTELTEQEPKLALDIAKDLIYSERQSQYGSFKDNMTKLSTLFETMTNIKLTEQQCTQFLIALKFARESTKHKRDNLVDVIGYIALLDDLYDKE